VNASTETTRRIVAEYVAALQQGDVGALRSSFAPDATWTLRGDVPVAGTWNGPEGILDGFLAQVVEQLDQEVPVHQDLHRIIADDDYAVAEWTSHARSRAGATYSNDYAVVFHVVDGLIQDVTEFCDTSYMKRVLFDQNPARPEVEAEPAHVVAVR
jgi:ketosteroid isomerase-like protein